MAEFRVADLAGASNRANQNVLGQLQIRDASQRLGQREQFNALAPQIAGGDQAAARQGFALDPQQTAQIMQGIAALEAPERERLRVSAENAAKSLFALEQLPEGQRGQAYQQWLGLAQQNGWTDQNDPAPAQYDPFWVQSELSEAMTLGDMVKRAQPMSGPGKVQADINAGRLPQGTPLQSSGVNVNMGSQGIDYGKPPKDMAWARNPDGSVALRQGENGFSSPVAVPIAGGPVERAAASAEQKAAAGQQQKSAQGEIVTQDIDRVLSLVDKATVPVTGVGSFLSVIPGTTAKDVSALTDTIKANIGFDKLQNMRDNSPTGGALGQVSEFENRLLQSTLGSLEQSQSKEQFTFNLKRLRETYLDIIHGPGNRPGGGGEKTAHNPQTGEKLIFRNGKWEPMQ